jgi:hypothetical protein
MLLSNTGVTTSVYEKALDTAAAELSALTLQRNELNKRIARLEATVDALGALMDLSPEPDTSAPEPAEEIGISEAIRQVLRTSPVPLTSPEIKAKLAETAFDDGISATDARVIDNTLKRLEQQGDVSLVGSVYLAVSL